MYTDPIVGAIDHAYHPVHARNRNVARAQGLKAHREYKARKEFLVQPAHREYKDCRESLVRLDPPVKLV